MRISDWSSDVCSSDLSVIDRMLVDVLQNSVWKRHSVCCFLFLTPQRLHPLQIARQHFDLEVHAITRFQRTAGGHFGGVGVDEIGSASCRERVFQYVYVPVFSVSL